MNVVFLTSHVFFLCSIRTNLNVVACISFHNFVRAIMFYDPFVLCMFRVLAAPPEVLGGQGLSQPALSLARASLSPSRSTHAA